MKIRVSIHEAEEGGYWAEVPSLPGCFSQGETIEELLDNIREAIACCLATSKSEVATDTIIREVEV